MELKSERGWKGIAATGARQEAVQLVENFVRAHAGSPVPISQLCSVAGLSERALRNAFYGVRGMSPKRFLVAQRLRGVRTALSDPGDTATVTRVATEFGFYELGRFAAAYRGMFGETPSETLHRRRSAAGNCISGDHERS